MLPGGFLGWLTAACCSGLLRLTGLVIGGLLARLTDGFIGWLPLACRSGLLWLTDRLLMASLAGLLLLLGQACCGLVTAYWWLHWLAYCCFLVRFVEAYWTGY